MKKSVLLTALMVVFILAAGFAAGQSTDKETRDLKGFTKIGYGISGSLYVNIGPEFKVVLEGDKKELAEIITEVKDGRLIIRKEHWRLNFNEKVNVYITMPQLNGLGVSGSGNAEIKDAVKTDDLNLSVSGSGKIYTAELDVADLSCSISGSGNIRLGDGKATKGDISLSGSGNFTGENFKFATLEASISGSGNVTCYATESLEAHVSGSGNITYSGNPKIDARVSGSGKVRSR